MRAVAISPVPVLQERHRRLLAFALAAGGAAFTVLVLTVGVQIGMFGAGNDYTATFDWVGDAMRSGRDPYVDTGLVYSPLFAVGFAAISWLPVPVANAIVVVVELLSLRYIMRSWMAVGLAGWCLLLPFELALGNLNLLLGALIAAAVRGHAWAGVVGGSLKISPVLAVRDWRSAGIGLAAILVLTLPWLGMWVEWARNLVLAVPSGGVGPMVPFPLWSRLLLAGPLLLLRRPWATALACVLAIPSFHYQTLLLLLVPLVEWVHGARTPARRVWSTSLRPSWRIRTTDPTS